MSQQPPPPHPSQPPYAQGPGSWSDVPPPGTKGVYTGPITGAPVSDGDAKLWAVLAQLSPIVASAVGLPFLGPLIIYLVYKDRNRFIRFHAAEALQGTILATILTFAIAAVTFVLAIVTFGLGMLLIFLAFVPGLILLIFEIIGAVKANERQWWPYPVNLRLFT
ncbi:MAG: DUF4870 domain-containing protein [Brachybacterium sp.]|nr:DUF4870 domain-containing protein [Brachybacterium sp.]